AFVVNADGMDSAETDCTSRTGAAVTMFPVTAAKGGRGVGAQGRMPELLARGVRVALGCDSPNNSNHLDLVRAMNMAAIQYKDARQDTTQIPAETALEMGTRLGAAAVGLGDEIGAIEPGKESARACRRAPGSPSRALAGLFCNGGPRNGPPYPPTLGVPRRSRGAPR